MYKPIRQWHLDVIPFKDAAAWSPDGTQIAAAATDGYIRIWNADSGEVVRTFKAHGIGGAYYRLIWNHLTNRLVGAMAHCALAYDPLTGDVLQNHKLRSSAFDLSRDCRLAYGRHIQIQEMDENLLPDIQQIDLSVP